MELIPKNIIFNCHRKVNKFRRRELKLRRENCRLRNELRADEILMSKLAKENKELLAMTSV